MILIIVKGPVLILIIVKGPGLYDNCQRSGVDSDNYQRSMVDSDNCQRSGVLENYIKKSYKSSLSTFKQKQQRVKATCKTHQQVIPVISINFQAKTAMVQVGSGVDSDNCQRSRVNSDNCQSSGVP